ncbi:/ udk / Uridine kinase /:346073 Reverse [Candidatus Hepatoplasma crinochetorum]|uniref:/ udk / Uridine kinase /:346073 Reverse n=1 Tax=Candidatus Hepatoplasma crinochetorum TaxID=295596 RepID=A0A0G7ZMQ3_9MOLU|nr:/ udk / Uridine kinase /:346073 Reverse [Candidatus Hepatoplasma crinochetorum]
MKKDNKIILISGGTASGKSKISISLAAIFLKKKINISFLSIDNYYYDQKEIKEIFKVNDLRKINFDDPNTINWKEFNSDLKKIFAGEDLERKIYNFETCNYDLEKTFKIEPTEYIIIEGIFAFFNQNLIKKAYKKIYIEADSDLRLIRRYKRDRDYRNKTLFNCNDFIDRWEQQIYPMFKKYLEKDRNKADYIILNNSERQIDIDKKAQEIFNLLNNDN